ncbi:MAG: polymer-forming cytoskeletal protein [Verrucomicrobiota bacterium]|nr:polymer-forming cytoskeletal protein [Verrucomicrobiota bacterium]
MPPELNKNYLATDIEIKGTIKFAADLTLDGKVEGEIISEAGLLTIAENAVVTGEIKTKSVIVMGKVNGNITVTERAELKAKAQLLGDIKATRLVIEEGATIVGKSEVTPNKGALGGIKPSGGTSGNSEQDRKSVFATPATGK